MLNRRDFIRGLGVCSAGIGVGMLLPGCSKIAGAEPALHEASYYKQISGKKVLCLLCPHGCQLPDEATGLCRVRTNRGGKLYSLVYGKPVTIHSDPIEKKPFYHFLPGSKAFSLATVGCNLHCSFCQNWEISQASPGEVPAYEGTPQQIVSRAKSAGDPVIACTYTEPIVFSGYVKDIAALASKEKLRTVMISAGFINEAPLKELCRHLAGIKIDLKSFSDSFYRNMTGGRLKPVLNALVTIKKSGTWLEIVNLVIPGKNDSPDEIKNMSLWIKKNLGADVPVHFTRFIPMYKLKNVPPTPTKTLEDARKIAMNAGLNYVYVGNLPGHPGNNTYCPKCKRLLIERMGYSINMKNMKNGKCAHCGKIIAGVWK